MKEELSKNEDIVFTRQNDKVKNNRGNAENIQRRYVNSTAIIAGLLLAVAMLCLWMLRLLDVVSLPQ